MLKPESRALLQELARTMHGNALREYLKEKREVIGDIKLCTSWEHTVGRQYALEVLDEVFSFLEEKKTTDKTPNQYT